MRESLAIVTGLLLLCSAARAEAQALDTTVTIQVRTRRASTGRTTITTTVLPPSKPRVDTVLVVRRDTVYVPKSTGLVVVGDTVKVPFTQVRYGPFVDADSQDVFLGLGSEYLGRITPVGSVFRVAVYSRGVVGLSTLGEFPTRSAALAALYAMWIQ